MENRTAPLVIGVDGGGSGCRAAIAQAGAVLATAEGGPANVTTDIESSIHNVRWAIEAAATQVGLAGQLGGAYAYFGLAGAQSEAQQAQVAAAFRFAHLEVAEDRPAAVVGALGAREGCVISAGTGTIAGVLRGGQFRFVGGWGFQLSDHASGAWLGRMALEWALAAWERLRDHSDLTWALMSQFDSDPRAVARFAGTAQPGDFGAFAPQVLEAAEAGDGMAVAVMQQGATHLTTMLRALGHKPGEVLCLTGGVGRFYAPYLPVETRAGLISPEGTALDGALRLAARHAEVRA